MGSDGVRANDGAPRVSVVIPARNCPGQLRFCLDRLGASTQRGFEVIVVDDASTDATAEVAAESGATVLRLEVRLGPAGAFIDADVGVHPRNIGLILEAFDADPGLDALFGSYDLAPTQPNFISQYRNLFHHFVHQQGNEQASTFWSGCGAIRRQVFEAHGGFDPGLYDRPSIEDIELGARLVRAGHRIAVKKEILVTHIKTWTLWAMVRTDLFDRGIPWTRLILRERSLPDDLNVSLAQRASVALAGLILVAFLVGAWSWPWLLVLPVALGLAVAGADRWTGNHPVGIGLRAAAVLVSAGAAAGLAWALPTWASVTGGLVLGIVLLNLRLYVFFGRQRGLVFALGVLPLHLLYLMYSGLALGIGLLLHLRDGAPGPAVRGDGKRSG